MKNALIAGCLIGGIGLAAAPVYEAVAAPCCDPWGFVGFSAFIQAGTNVVASVTSSATNIVQVLANEIHPDWWKGVNAQQAMMVHQTAAQKTLFDAKAAVDAKLSMQDRLGNSAVESVASSSQASSMQAAQAFSLQDVAVAKNLAEANKAIQDAEYGRVRKDLLAVIERHKPYCSAQDQVQGRCSAAALDMQDRDIRFDALLTPGGERLTFTQEEVQAAKVFVQNILLSIPDELPKADSPQGEALRSYQLMDSAVLSTVANSLNEILARRMPNDTTPDHVSVNENLVKEVSKRFLSPDWYAQESGKSTAPLLTEYLHMLALGDYLDLQKTQSRERIELLLAIRQDRANLKDIQPRLDNQRSAAARGGR